MTGTDIFIIALSALIFFGGLYLNFTSRKLVAKYNEAHKPEPIQVKSANQKSVKKTKK